MCFICSPPTKANCMFGLCNVWFVHFSYAENPPAQTPVLKELYRNNPNGVNWYRCCYVRAFHILHVKLPGNIYIYVYLYIYICVYIYIYRNPRTDGNVGPLGIKLLRSSIISCVFYSVWSFQRCFTLPMWDDDPNNSNNLLLFFRIFNHDNKQHPSTICWDFSIASQLGPTPKLS